MTGRFAPWSEDGGLATSSDDGKTVTATMPVRPGLKITRAQVVSGTFLVVTFERTEETPCPD